MTNHDPTPLDDQPQAEPDSMNPDASTATDNIFSQPNRMAELEQQLKEAQERVLRAQAEAENSRRRMRREMEEERRYASQNLLTDLLPVLDNVRRAVEAAEKSDPDSSLLQGVRMVSQLLEDVLARHHCPRIAALGTEFDPTQHEAIAQQPSNTTPAGHVLLVAQEGFRLHERVIRPAQVIVSTGSAQ